MRALVARLDSDGDVLLAGAAVRAVAARAEVTLLVSPAGEAAARLLPGVEDVVVWACPWSGYAPPPVDADATQALVADLAGRRPDAAVVLTSFHQSPLPTALLLRLAGVRQITAESEDYPGSLLDVRCRAPLGDVPEAERMLAIAEAAGFPRPAGDDARLAVRRPLPGLDGVLPHRFRVDPRGYMVVHPGASVPARAASPDRMRAVVAALVAAGRRVVVTGGPGERALTASVAAGAPQRCLREVLDLGGRTDLPTLAAVLDGASCVVVGNTGPAHLAAAVGTPVVSLFAPVVPAARWAPYGVPVRLLGSQDAPCRATRARTCPVEGHPCLDLVDPAEVVVAVEELAPTVARAVTPSRVVAR